MLRLGHAMRYDVWLPRNDRKAVWAGKRITDLPGVLNDLPPTSVLPEDRAQRLLENVDVLWLEKGHITAAFEVEHTTPIYSGLLRMSDLMVLFPHLSMTAFVVAPEARLDLVKAEIHRPTFNQDRIKLTQRCRVITFERLKDDIDRLEDVRMRFLKMDYVMEHLSTEP